MNHDSQNSEIESNYAQRDPSTWTPANIWQFARTIPTLTYLMNQSGGKDFSGAIEKAKIKIRAAVLAKGGLSSVEKSLVDSGNQSLKELLQEYGDLSWLK